MWPPEIWLDVERNVQLDRHTTAVLHTPYRVDYHIKYGKSVIEI